MNAYLYMDGKVLVRVWANKRPSEWTIPKRGTWVGNIWNVKKNEFEMPCFPEIPWGILKKMAYLGRLAP